MGRTDLNEVPNPDPRKIRCEVCEKVIDRAGGTARQYVHAGEDNKKSECQKTARYAREHGITIAEAKERRRR